MNIKRNSLYGLLGFALPSVVMLVAFPILVRYLGTEQFGIYFLATSVSGSAAFLDFGISSATLKLVAEDLSIGDRRAAANAIITSSAFYGGLGILGAVLIAVLSPWLVSLFSVKLALRSDAILVFRLAAIQFAFYFVITNLVSIFKGMQRFDQSALALSSLSILTYGGAAIGVAWAGVHMVGVTLISLSANVTVLSICVWKCLSLCQAQGVVLRAARPTLSAFRRMFGFGLAMSVHAIAALFFLQGLRMLVGILLNPAAVAIYVLGATATSKAHAMVNAATEVMFPLSSATKSHTQLRRVYLRMLFASGVMAAVILGSLALFAEQILTLWVGADLASKATPLMQVLAVGYFMVALSPAPFHLVNGLGKPWFNVFFDICKVLLAATGLAAFTLNGTVLADFAWAFAFANVITGLAFQASVEILIWRKGLLASKALSKIEL